MTYIEMLKAHNATHTTYNQNDFLAHFANEADEKEFKKWYAINKSKPISTFSGVSNDWQAFIPAAIQAEAIQYGLVSDMPTGLITTVGATGDHIRHKWVYKTEGIEDYVEGESFKETFIEGATAIERWRKPAAKIANSYEAIKDIPLDLVAMNVSLTLNEFKAREWKHFSHEMHKSTSNKFPSKATDKNGNPLLENGSDVTWRDLFENAVDGSYPSDQFKDVKTGRHTMLNRERDAATPTVCIMNASTEATMSDNDKVNIAMTWGTPNTYLQTGKLPSVYGLQYLTIPDAHYGYFNNDVTRKNAEFVKTNDIFLLATGNGPTILRYTREPLSTETWRIFDGQKEALNIWERYNYGCYRYTNILRISYNHTKLDTTTGKLD